MLDIIMDYVVNSHFDIEIFNNWSASYPKERFLKATINNKEDICKK